jgi:hypothetical protein
VGPAQAAGAADERRRSNGLLILCAQIRPYFRQTPAHKHLCVANFPRFRQIATHKPSTPTNADAQTAHADKRRRTNRPRRQTPTHKPSTPTNADAQTAHADKRRRTNGYQGRFYLLAAGARALFVFL